MANRSSTAAPSRARPPAASGPWSWFRGPRPAGAVDDQVIVTELYRVYGRPLLSFVLRLTGGDRHWAEDVVQETMIRAWRSAHQLDENAASLLPWLATVARRIVIDDQRRKNARPQEAGEGPLENMRVPDGSSPNSATPTPSGRSACPACWRGRPWAARSSASRRVISASNSAGPVRKIRPAPSNPPERTFSHDRFTYP